MDNNPLVSVIIPVYNAVDYLEECLKSIIAQTYKVIEIICVNDGSSDGSNIILTKYESAYPFIKVIHQENKGQSIASNVALQHANGAYIKFFDADDIMNSQHIQKQVEKLNGMDDCIASCEWGRFYNNNIKSARFIEEPVWKDMPSFMFLKTVLGQKTDMLGAWLWLIPKKIIEKTGGWNERLNLNNDFEFSVRLLLQSKEVVFAEGAKVYYRSGRHFSLSRTLSRNSFESAILTTELGFSLIFAIDNSKQMKTHCANRYQTWIYRFFPLYPDLIANLENRIAKLGGSSVKCDGGPIFKFISFFIGWKKTKLLQIFSYKHGWQFILHLKNKIYK